MRDGNYERGEDRYSAKLTEDDVRAIRRESLRVSNRVLGDRYGVSPVAVWKARRRLSWAHVE